MYICPSLHTTLCLCCIFLSTTTLGCLGMLSLLIGYNKICQNLRWYTTWIELLVYNSFMICSYVIASMGLQVTWSFMLALLDAYALLRKKMLHNPILVSLFVVGDWVRILSCLRLYFVITIREVHPFINSMVCRWQQHCLSLQLLLPEG